jgi:hypothetical protein
LTSSSSRSSALPGPPPGVSGSPTGNFRPHPVGHPPGGGGPRRRYGPTVEAHV